MAAGECGQPQPPAAMTSPGNRFAGGGGGSGANIYIKQISKGVKNWDLPKSTALFSFTKSRGVNWSNILLSERRNSNHANPKNSQPESALLLAHPGGSGGAGN